MSKEQTQNAELYARDAAARLAGPMDDFRNAIQQQLEPVVRYWDVAAGVGKDSEKEAIANEAFILKAVGLLPVFEKRVKSWGDNYEEIEYVLPRKDAASALLAHRSILWGPWHGVAGGHEPYYPVGQDGGTVLVVPAYGEDRQLLALQRGTADWGILRDKEMYGKVTKREKIDLNSFRDTEAQDFKVSFTRERSVSNDPTSEWVRESDQSRKPQSAQKGISGTHVETYKVIKNMTTLMANFDKADEFAELSPEWSGMLEPQKEGSEADPAVVKELAGKMGITGTVRDETARAYNHLDLG